VTDRPDPERQEPWPSPLPPEPGQGTADADGWEAAGWPAPADARSPSSDRTDEAAERPTWSTPAPPPPPRPPRRRSRNPIVRLTAGLPRWLRITIDWAITIVGAIAIVLLVKAFVVNPYRIPSSSMEPTLHCAEPAPGCEASFSDRVLANRFIYHLREPRRGEIVVFETPPEAQVRCGAGGTFVKRLVGLPGETIEIRQVRGDGYVFVNGRRLDEPYLDAGHRTVTGPMPARTIPAGHYFMMGDNRPQSCDSREWGSVPRENLIGKVFATYWPPNRISLH
jgi:signal peptidase I